MSKSAHIAIVATFQVLQVLQVPQVLRVLQVLLVLLVLGLSACSKGQLATVDGKGISQAEFDAFLKFKRIPPQDEKRREQALAEYLDREALAAAIEKQPVLNKELIDAELNEFRKEMIISRYFEQILRDKVNDEAVKNFYDKHAKDYEQREVHVAHILVRTNKGMSEAERRAKLTTAQEAYSQVTAGKDFAQVADALSEDRTSAKKGGDLGWLKEGTIDPAFSKRAFEMKAGTISEPIETPFGFHVVKVLEEARVVRRPYQAVAGDIQYQLRNEAKEAETARLKGLAHVERKKPYVLAAKAGDEKGDGKSTPTPGPSISQAARVGQ
jgi:peptidyl-prolyl cis-trans isomerase C